MAARIIRLSEVMETDKQYVERKLLNIRNQIGVIGLSLSALKIALDQLVMEQNDLVSLLATAFEEEKSEPQPEAGKQGDQKNE